VSADAAVQTPGRPGDFNFLAGEWRIANRRRVSSHEGEARWDEFEGSATVWSALEGAASVEELRIPARGFAGLGIRLLDVAGQRWADHWVSGRSGVLLPQPLWGGFVDGVGLFEADDTDEHGQPLRVKGVWDQITATTCRWWQATSRDGGANWEPDWFMHWSRVGRAGSGPG
jgi:hypothetical protein